MLFPLSHEKMSGRRLPVVTIGLIFLTIVLHGIMGLASSGSEERAVSAVVKAHVLYMQKPSLGVCAPLKPFLVGNGMTAPETPYADLLQKLGDDADKQDVTDRYEAACKDIADAVGSIPAQRFGYVPARANFFGLFTYMFVHADWWHVIGNMWFLFLCGLALEDRWGRLAFLGYYLVAGVVAAGVHHLALSDSTRGLIGASGAVAGAMGAFVVLFATTKIRFVGFLGFRLIWFSAPAYVMLPLWAIVELLYGLLSASSGTAHWAHIGGFAFGLMVAAAFRKLGVDKRLDDAVERVAVLGDDPRIDTARALVAKGEAEQAVALLEGLLQEKPGSSHVQDALREARSASTPAAAPAAPPVRRTFVPSIPSVRSVRSMPAAPVTGSVGDSDVSASASATATVAAIQPEAAPFFPPPPPRR